MPRDKSKTNKIILEMLIKTIRCIIIIFSDNKKGNDDVIMCKFNSISSSSVQSYYNGGKSTSKSSNPNKGLSNVTVANNNGVLNCQFRREKFISDQNYNSLYYQWYILLAKGSLSGGKPILILNIYIKNKMLNFVDN